MSSEVVWRAPTLADIPAIIELAVRWDTAFDTLEATSVSELEHRLRWDGGIEEISRVVVDCGQVVGAAWIRTAGAYSETRYHLHAFTEPARRSLYHDLVAWLLEDRPTEPARCDHAWRFDRVLAPPFQDLDAAQRALYATLGFERVYVEHEMVCDTSGSAFGSVAHVDLKNWTPSVHGEIRAAYNAAFGERGFSGYDENSWNGTFRPDLNDFKPEFSFVFTEGGAVVGFVFATILNDLDDWCDPAIRGLGWIDSIGVRPTHKGRGIATALIGQTVDALRESGVDQVGLRVNDDNVRAQRLYEHLGFVHARKHVVYRRAVKSSG